MIHSRCRWPMMVIAVLTVVGLEAQPQDRQAIDRARRVLDLLNSDQYDEVAKEFTAKVAAALPASQLRSVWSGVRQQFGAFTAVVEEQVSTPAPGITQVTLGCQFEKSAINLILAFDPENKIGGIRFAPRASATDRPAVPTSTRFKDEDVTVGAGEWALPGTLSLPVGPIDAAVVLVHGSGPNDRDETVGPNKPFRDIAWGLADRGIAVLRYEKRTRQHGAKIAAIKNFTVRDETIDDAVAAVALLRARKELNPKRIFVLGHSLGGTVAPRIARQDPSIAGLIIAAGTTRPIQEVVREQFAYLKSLNPDGPSVDESVATLLKAAPDGYWKDLDAHKPAEVAATLKIPMLILQGERDYQVTMADLKGWRDALGGRANVTIRSYPALNHLFMAGEGKSTPAEYMRPGRVPESVIDEIAQWLKKTGTV